MNEEGKQRYFAVLAPKYNLLTGYTTQDIFAKFLDMNGSKIDINSSSIVHDNASGPGTAAEILIERYSTGTNTNTGQGPPAVVATDYSPAMIEALQSLQASRISANPSWDKLTSKVLNSEDLSAAISDNYFTHSISNFSLFTVTNAVQSLRETYRTLKPGGVAVVLLWKRFAVQHLLAAAQDQIKGDGYAAAHAMPINGPQYFEKEVVPQQLVEAGFDAAKMETLQLDHLVLPAESDRESNESTANGVSMEEKWDGLFQVMTKSPLAIGSVKGFEEDEVKRWPDAVKWAIEDEQKREGGLRFESWITIARK